MMQCGVLLIVVASLTGHVIGQLEFTVEPVNVSVESGMKATLSCKATGASAILYVWHKGNISEGLGVTSNSSDRIHFANHSNITENYGTLVFNEVTTDDEGVYFCRAMEHNNASHFIISNPAYLTVTMVTTVSLSVTVLPEDNVTVRNDTEVLLHCVAMGDTDNITYSWYKDDAILLSDHRVSVLDNGSLLINVTDYRHDNGDYYCEAIDYHGNNASSDSTSLSVVYLEEKFLEQPVNKSLTLNETHDTKIIIDCIAPEGYPMVTVSWIRQLSNGEIVLVEEDDRITIRLKWLTVKAAWVNDTGFYQCVASNGYYERSSHFAYINVLPSIKPPCPELSFNSSRPPDYGVIGKPLSLHCTTSGSHGWKYTWKKSGQTFTQFNRTLILDSYHDYDNGTYSCFISSSAECNQKANAAHIDVNTATIGNFTSVSQPISAGVGRPFHLNCTSSEAKPAANMTWIFNGVAIATSVPATSAQEETYVDYTHSSAELSDGGVYVCRAENIAGFLESSVNVTIFERPSVTINSEVVQLGNNAVLKCSSSSLTVTDIIWQHNRSPLHNDGDKYVIELSSNNLSTLTVTDIGEDDFGPYRCNITDDLHVNIFVTGYINHTNKIYFTHDVSVAQAEVGRTVQFTCSVAGVVTDVTFTWFEDNHQLYNNEKYHMIYSDNGLIHSSQLTIMAVGDNERYSYYCQAHDMDSKMIQTNFTLTTKLRPFFRTRPRNITMVAIGGTLSIHCDIDGRPKPSVTWTHDNFSEVKNDSSRLISFPNGTLVITTVVKSDYGIYFCHAAGNREVNYEVHIVEASSSDDSEDDKIERLADIIVGALIGGIVIIVAIIVFVIHAVCLIKRAKFKIQN